MNNNENMSKEAQELKSSMDKKVKTLSDVPPAMLLNREITDAFDKITRKEIKKYLKNEIENDTLDWSENTQHVIEYLPKLVDIEKVDINEIITEEQKINIIRESISKRNKERNTPEKYMKVLKKLTNKELNKISNDLIFCDNIHKTKLVNNVFYIKCEKGDDFRVFSDYITELMERKRDSVFTDRFSIKKFIKGVLSGKSYSY